MRFPKNLLRLLVLLVLVILTTVAVGWPASTSPSRWSSTRLLPRSATATVSPFTATSAGKPSDAVDCDGIAKTTDGFSGADLKAVVDLAVEAKLRDAMKSGKLEPMRTKDLIAAAGQVKPSTKDWFATARNYALYSNQGGVYDEILKYMKM